jgi:hypothetical protein
VSKFITTHNETDKEKYPCWNADECFSSWTYDNWHCTGCQWKGLGIQDIKFGGKELEDKAAKVREKIFLKLPKVLTK